MLLPLIAELEELESSNEVKTFSKSGCIERSLFSSLRSVFMDAFDGTGPSAVLP